MQSRPTLLAVVALVGLQGGGQVLLAQSLQRLSLQGSGALVFPTSEVSDFDYSTRLGWEAQVRYTFSRFSLGAGYQRSTVYKVDSPPLSGAVSVGFLEPRYVAAATARLAGYLAGRAGIGSLVCDPPDCADQSVELVLGGGAGVLVQMTQRLAVDIGGQFFTTRFTQSGGIAKARTGYVLARVGLSLGL